MKINISNDVVQGNLFSGVLSVDTLDSENTKVLKQMLPMPDAKVLFYPNFFDFQESDRIFRVLLDETKWRQDKMNVYGKQIDLPRKTAWYGDRDKVYTFSGIQLHPEPWTKTLQLIKQRIEDVSDTSFNSVLLNLYRDGNDGISWHTDAESELGENPIIGSVSFGGTRKFMFRHRFDKEVKTEIELTHGSFLLMGGETQHFWQHQVPKSKKKVEPRINLTFRVIID
ncbi:MAG: alpha-ketoglutarate-dependent dioxygenase AlkB [Pseudanabaenaceae cyanobacterium bins.68]|nr:alpha-ketoglutarate-dependent dioxygenase AlkB [Pseudanabaenaceae cyanobacterium bins.68]